MDQTTPPSSAARPPGRRPRGMTGPAGMTLVEVLIVVGIIALLISMVIAFGGSSEDSTKAKQTQHIIATLEAVLDEYQRAAGGPPPLPPANPGARTMTGTPTAPAPFIETTRDFLRKAKSIDACKSKLKSLGEKHYDEANNMVFDGWEREILMHGPGINSGSAAGQGARSPRERWFWSRGKDGEHRSNYADPPAPNQPAGDTSKDWTGNPVKSDDIGGNNNPRK